MITEPPEEPPEYLKAEARARWIEIQRLLIRSGTWTDDWSPSLEQLANLYQHLAEIDFVIEEAEKEGRFSLMVPTGKGHSMGIKVNPLLEFRLDVIKQIRVCLKDFNLTPSVLRLARNIEDTKPTTAAPTIETRPRLANLELDVA